MSSIAWRVIDSPNVNQARLWLENAGIGPPLYDNSEMASKPNMHMLDRQVVDQLEEKEWYPDEITINPFDDPITCRLGGHN